MSTRTRFYLTWHMTRLLEHEFAVSTQTTVLRAALYSLGFRPNDAIDFARWITGLRRAGTITLDWRISKRRPNWFADMLQAKRTKRDVHTAKIATDVVMEPKDA